MVSFASNFVNCLSNLSPMFANQLVSYAGLGNEYTMLTNLCLGHLFSLMLRHCNDALCLAGMAAVVLLYAVHKKYGLAAWVPWGQSRCIHAFAALEQTSAASLSTFQYPVRIQQLNFFVTEVLKVCNVLHTPTHGMCLADTPRLRMTPFIDLSIVRTMSEKQTEVQVVYSVTSYHPAKLADFWAMLDALPLPTLTTSSITLVGTESAENGIKYPVPMHALTQWVRRTLPQHHVRCMQKCAAAAATAKPVVDIVSENPAEPTHGDDEGAATVGGVGECAYGLQNTPQLHLAPHLFLAVKREGTCVFYVLSSNHPDQPALCTAWLDTVTAEFCSRKQSAFADNLYLMGDEFTDVYNGAIVKYSVEMKALAWFAIDRCGCTEYMQRAKETGTMVRSISSSSSSSQSGGADTPHGCGENTLNAVTLFPLIDTGATNAASTNAASTSVTSTNAASTSVTSTSVTSGTADAPSPPVVYLTVTRKTQPNPASLSRHTIVQFTLQSNGCNYLRAFVRNIVRMHEDRMKADVDTALYHFVYNGLVNNTPHFSKRILTKPGTVHECFETFDKLHSEHEPDLRRNLERLRDIEYYRARGLKRKQGYLFHGSPGCGKTATVKAMALHDRRHIVEIPFFLLTKHDEFERIMTLTSIENVPVDSTRILLLFDEIDIGMTNLEPASSSSSSSSSLSSSSSSSLSHGAQTTAAATKESLMVSSFAKRNTTDHCITLGTLLSQLDGISNHNGLVVVATTNHLDHLPPAIYRALRLTPILFQALRREDCLSILRMYFAPDICRGADLRVPDRVFTPADFITRCQRHEADIDPAAAVLRVLAQNK